MEKHEMALELLERVLAEGGYGLGDKLPSERQLVTQLGVSRRALRQAMSRLEAQGRVWRGVGQGTFVGSVAYTELAAVSGVERLTNPTEVVDVRQLLEPRIAALAAKRSTTGDVAEMERALVRSDVADDYGVFDLWDGRFHWAIAKAAQHRLLLTLFEVVSAVRFRTDWGASRRFKLNEERRSLYANQHHKILDAIRDRDEAAAFNATKVHLDTVRDSLLPHSR